MDVMGFSLHPRRWTRCGADASHFLSNGRSLFGLSSSVEAALHVLTISAVVDPYPRIHVMLCCHMKIISAEKAYHDELSVTKLAMSAFEHTS